MEDQEWKDVIEYVGEVTKRNALEETASSLTGAAYPGTYVVPNYECMGYVLYIGDIDDELDGLYIGGFDTDYYELECNVRLFSYRFKRARSIKCE